MILTPQVDPPLHTEPVVLCLNLPPFVVAGHMISMTRINLGNIAYTIFCS
jgi:hypothetical protein